jgi:hypothetical protein
MSLQQVLELVRVHHIFWENELQRASRRERGACEFFRQQVRDEVAVLTGEVEAAAAYRASLRSPHPESDQRLSSARPPTRMMRGLS